MKYLKYFENSENILNIDNRELFNVDDYLKYFNDDTIKVINIYQNNIKYIPILPKNLERLVAGHNNLKELPELPNYLKELFILDNKLKELPKLPENIIKISCGQNKLTVLPKLPNSLKYLYCECNRLKKLPKLPKSLIELRIGLNDWTEPISYELIKKYDLDKKDANLYHFFQIENFKKYEFQKEFLTKNPEKYKDLELIGYDDKIKEEFDWLFNASDMGLM